MSIRQRAARAIVSSDPCKTLFNIVLMCLLGVGTALAETAPLPAGLTQVTRSDVSGCANAARQFVAAVEASDGSYLQGILHKEALVALVADGIPFSDEEKAAFGQSMLGMLDQVPSVIAASAPNGMDISFRGVLARSGTIHALVRLDLGEMGLNYFELKLARADDGRVVIYDWYDYAQGDDYSANVRNLGALASGQPEVIEIINGVTGIDADAARLTPIFMKQLQQRQLAAAESTWASMPPALRYARPILMQYVKLTAMTGDSEKLMRSMSALSEHHGEDPRLALILADHYYMTQDRAGLFGALAGMKRYMGIEDAGIVQLEAAYHEGLGESVEAEQAARKAITLEPDHEDSHWILVEALLSQQKYPDVTVALQQLRSRFGYEFNAESLSAEPAYAGFLQSQAFRDWMGGSPEAPAGL